MHSTAGSTSPQIHTASPTKLSVAVPDPYFMEEVSLFNLASHLTPLTSFTPMIKIYSIQRYISVLDQTIQELQNQMERVRTSQSTDQALGIQTLHQLVASQSSSINRRLNILSTEVGRDNFKQLQLNGLRKTMDGEFQKLVAIEQFEKVAETEKSSAGTSAKSQRPRNERYLIIICVLLVIGVSVGLGVGLSQRRSKKVSSSAGLDGSSTATLPTSTSGSSTLAESISSTSDLSHSDISTTAAVAQPTTLTSTDTSLESVLFGYSFDDATTEIFLTYVVPTTPVETRTDGKLQWSSTVTLPDPANPTESFTSFVRFRVRRFIFVPTRKY